MSDWRYEFDMTHALTTNLCTCYFNTAALADNALESDALVLTAVALPITSRSKDLLIKETIFFWLQCSVVNSFWLLYLAE